MHQNPDADEDWLACVRGQKHFKINSVVSQRGQKIYQCVDYDIFFDSFEVYLSVVMARTIAVAQTFNAEFDPYNVDLITHVQPMCQPF